MLYQIGYPDFILDDKKLRKHYENVSNEERRYPFALSRAWNGLIADHLRAGLV